MISQLLIHPEINSRTAKIHQILQELKLSQDHPDVLFFDEESKLGIEAARKIQQFLSLKPFQGDSQAIVILTAENLTLDAQNALLKTLEEPPTQATIILGVNSEDQLLPTIISRCQLILLPKGEKETTKARDKLLADIEKLMGESTEKRFQYIEKLDEKEIFLSTLTTYFHAQLPKQKEFLKDLIQAEEWASSNVNIRAILEYLMLKMPQKEK